MVPCASMRPVWAAAAVLGFVAAPGAQVRLPMPDEPARAAAHEELLEVLASIQVQPGQAAATAVDRLLAAAADGARSAVLRCELFEQALRCARAAADVTAGLRAAAAFEAAFAVDDVDEVLLARFAAEGRAPAQALAGACLDGAQQLLDDPTPAFAARLAQARRLAAADVPRGLRAAVEAAAAELEAVRAVAERVQAAPGDQALALRYRTHYRGDWPDRAEEVGDGTDRVARNLRSKIAARTPPGDVMALARAGELWWSLCAQEHDAVAQRHLSRRAMQLLLPMALVDTSEAAPTDAQPAAAPRPEAAEVERVRRLLAQATARARAPGIGALRFADAADLDQLLITGGAWRVEGGRLLGRSLGPDVATRATATFAWRRIDCITLRAGIQSDDGLNLRLAVGTVNILFNWEVADANHFYFGDTFQTTAPRLLQGRREHAIELRQLDENVAVFLDGQRVAIGPGTLAGTVTVYPALGSEIFVSAIDVVGDPDLGRVVAGPDHAR